LSPTIWENPFKVGQDGAHLDALHKYINYLPESRLASRLSDLDGMKLACDCPSNQPCHADVIIGARMMQIHSQSKNSKKRKFPRKLLLMAGVRVVRAMPLPFAQVSAYALIQQQYPQVNFSHVKWPLLKKIFSPILHFVLSGIGSTGRGYLLMDLLGRMFCLGVASPLSEQVWLSKLGQPAAG